MMQAVAAAIFFTLLSGSVCAQSTANPPGFEGADIHVSPHRTFPYYQGGFLQGDRYVLRQATMVDLIATAYGVDASTVQEGPTWLETDRFDVTAKVPAAIALAAAPTTRATAQLMLLPLLQDRF